jgi:ABC-type sugar transport system ATPase subunit
VESTPVADSQSDLSAGEPSTSPARAPTLEVRQLVKSFGGVHALDGVTLHADRGLVTALCGENGAGKSTLIKCLVGVLRPDSGQILVEGQVTHFDNPIDARLAGLETVYQDLALAENLDVASNVYLGREVHGGWRRLWALNKRQMASHSAEILDNFGIRSLSPSTLVRSLSGGQRQAVGIARATGWGTRAVIMDEPTAALGVRESERVIQEIIALAKKNVAILLVSHNIPQVLEVSDHIWILRAGRLVASLKTSESNHREVVGYITGMTDTAG